MTPAFSQTPGMRSRPLVLLLAGLNLVLAAGWYFANRPVVYPRVPPVRRASISTNIIRTVRTNVVTVRQAFSWREIESGDYFTYIHNLRSIGCPESTIRDIIVADVSQLFARRRAREITMPEHHWWKSDPDMDLLEGASDKIREMEAEKRALLTELLGPRWQVGADPGSLIDQGIRLDGPLLSDLSDETRLAVWDIERRNRQQLESLRRAAREEGVKLAPAEVAKLRLQARDELAKVLKPEELEEYLLRYSENANGLRESLRGFDASQDEFRKLFRATDAIDLQLQALAGTEDPASARRRAELVEKRESELKAALSEERYRYYQLNQDETFRDARDTTQALEMPAEAVIPLYQIQKAADEERRRIMLDQALTPEQRSEQLGQLHEGQLESIRKLLGEEAFSRYQSLPGR
jgi:hypothetical protein